MHVWHCVFRKSTKIMSMEKLVTRNKPQYLKSFKVKVERENIVHTLHKLNIMKLCI